jgi:RNA polymerase sigma factor (sigma-70 family)
MAEHALSATVGWLRTRLAEDHRELTDRQLLERFLDRQDEGAFAALVRRHERLVQSAVAKVLTDANDIEDAFQATFLVLVRKAKAVKWQAGLGTWLYAVAHRIAVHARAEAHQRRCREEATGRSQSEAANAAPDLSWREACLLLHEELDRLPDKFRLPLLLCYLEGKSRDEAAAQLGLTVATVKGRLERGRKRARTVCFCSALARPISRTEPGLSLGRKATAPTGSI